MCFGWIGMLLAFVLGMMSYAGVLLVLGKYFPPGQTGNGLGLPGQE